MPLSKDFYTLTKVGNKYQVELKNIKSGTFYARATAAESGFYTYYEFILVVKCIDNCEI